MQYKAGLNSQAVAKNTQIKIFANIMNDLHDSKYYFTNKYLLTLAK